MNKLSYHIHPDSNSCIWGFRLNPEVDQINEGDCYASISVGAWVPCAGPFPRHTEPASIYVRPCKEPENP